MRIRVHVASVIGSVCLLIGSGSTAFAQVPSANPGESRKEALVAHRASGTFEVKLTPQPTTNGPESASRGRLQIDKQFRGDLEGTSKGEMLTAGTSVKGSAGYVAIEQVSGMLHDRRGSFMLQHTGVMTRGAAQLTITVVPDSGTDELLGLAGMMVITIADGKHSYQLDYTLAGTP